MGSWNIYKDRWKHNDSTQSNHHNVESKSIYLQLDEQIDRYRARQIDILHMKSESEFSNYIIWYTFFTFRKLWHNHEMKMKGEPEK